MDQTLVSNGNFVPPRAQRLAAAGRAQDREPQRSCRRAVDPAEPRHELWNVGVGHRRVVTALAEAARVRQHVVEPALPPRRGRLIRVDVPGDLRRRQHGLDAGAQARRGFRRPVPDRLQQSPDGVGVDLIDGHVPNRSGVGGQRRRPLSCVLGAAPPAFVRPDVGVGALAEGRLPTGRRDHGLASVAHRVDLVLHQLAHVDVFCAGVGERHCWVRSKRRFAFATVRPVAIDPVDPAAGVEHSQEQAVAVAVSPLAPHEAVDAARGKFSHGKSLWSDVYVPADCSHARR